MVTRPVSTHDFAIGWIGRGRGGEGKGGGGGEKEEATGAVDRYPVRVDIAMPD